ncbi:sugar phosphate isomerase/epimerase [Kineococcus sp. NBC_00420]|uniref:sugar phosphate isomerase/epimerase family protein n=1 Tax=Kineococcus sp. NBC_00420 TaxID=2903564 RepID=UPI002E1CB90A
MPETPLTPSTPRARLAYNANGLRSVSLDDAVRTLADRGYDGIELSLNAQHIDPWTFSAADAARLRETLAANGMVACSLATGDPHLLSEEAFEPALVDPDPAERARRLDLLQRSVRIGVLVGVPLVVFSTGKRRPEVGAAQADAWLDEALAVLLDTLHETLDAAGLPRGSTVLGIEPEPGFHCRTNADVAVVLERTASPDLWLSQDLGHCVVEEEDALGSLSRHLPITRHLQVEDIADRVHAHLVPGDGDVDFDAVGRVLADGYEGWISVELYDHDPVHRDAAQRSEEFLRERFPSLARPSRSIDLSSLETRSTASAH